MLLRCSQNLPSSPLITPAQCPSAKTGLFECESSEETPEVVSQATLFLQTATPPGPGCVPWVVNCPAGVGGAALVGAPSGGCKGLLPKGQKACTFEGACVGHISFRVIHQDCSGC
jgi:hypothetical protein